jgi:hypothetical protein
MQTLIVRRAIRIVETVAPMPEKGLIDRPSVTLESERIQVTAGGLRLSDSAHVPPGRRLARIRIYPSESYRPRKRTDSASRVLAGKRERVKLWCRQSAI